MLLSLLVTYANFVNVNKKNGITLEPADETEPPGSITNNGTMYFTLVDPTHGASIGKCEFTTHFYNNGFMSLTETFLGILF
jgi:hypothetical protein